jgi:hypothetical protein
VTATQILREADEFLRRGWARGASAVDEEGNPVEPWSPLAQRWSALGALQAVWGWSEAPELSRGELERATLALSAVVGDIQEWNDAPERTLAEALAAFVQAAQLLDAENDTPPAGDQASSV